MPQQFMRDKCTLCGFRHSFPNCRRACFNCGLRHPGSCKKLCFNCSEVHESEVCPWLIVRPPPLKVLEAYKLERNTLYSLDLTTREVINLGQINQWRALVRPPRASELPSWSKPQESLGAQPLTNLLSPPHPSSYRSSSRGRRVYKESLTRYYYDDRSVSPIRFPDDHDRRDRRNYRHRTPSRSRSPPHFRAPAPPPPPPRSIHAASSPHLPLPTSREVELERQLEQLRQEVTDLKTERNKNEVKGSYSAVAALPPNTDRSKVQEFPSPPPVRKELFPKLTKNPTLPTRLKNTTSSGHQQSPGRDPIPGKEIRLGDLKFQSKNAKGKRARRHAPNAPLKNRAAGSFKTSEEERSHGLWVGMAFDKRQDEKRLSPVWENPMKS